MVLLLKDMVPLKDKPMEVIVRGFTQLHALPLTTLPLPLPLPLPKTGPQQAYAGPGGPQQQAYGAPQQQAYGGPQQGYPMQ